MNWFKKLDPRVRVVSSMWFMTICFQIETLWQGIISFALVIYLFATNGFSFKSLGKILVPFGIFLLILTIMNMFFYEVGTVLIHWGPITITEEGIGLSLLYSYRLGLMFLFGSFLTRTTSQTEISDSFESLLSPLKKFGVPVREIALVFSLSMRFIPTITDEANQIREAQMSRGASLNSGSLISRISALIANVVPIFTGIIRHADALSLALEARGWNLSEKRGYLHPMKIKSFDWIYILIIVGLSVVTYITG